MIEIEELLGVTDRYWSLTFNKGGEEYMRASVILSKAGYIWKANNLDPIIHANNEARYDNIIEYEHFDLDFVDKMIRFRNSGNMHAVFNNEHIMCFRSLKLLEALLIIYDITI